MLKSTIYMFLLLFTSLLHSEITFTEVHNESELAILDRGYLLNIETYDNISKMFCQYDGGFTRVLVSKDSCKSWELEFLDKVQYVGSELLYAIEGKFKNNITLIALDAGYIYIKTDEEKNSNYKLIKTPSNGTVRNVDIFDKTIYISDRNALHMSADYGVTWETLKSINDFAISDFIVINENIISLIGTELKGGSASSYLSTNNGKEWTKNSLDYSVKDLELIGETLWACRGFSTGTGDQKTDVILKSEDYGLSWTVQYNQANKKEFGLDQIHFKDSLNGVATGNWGKILLTNDAGKTWEQQSLPSGLIGEKLCSSWSQDGKLIIGASYEGIYLEYNPNSISDYKIETIIPIDNKIIINETSGFDIVVYEIASAKIIKQDKAFSKYILNLDNYSHGAYIISLSFNDKHKLYKFIK